MFDIRPFQNTDPPEIVRVWRNQGAERGLIEQMSVPLLEHFVLGKLYFDRQGLLVAECDGQVVGFAHAGFGPNADRSDLAHEVGVTCAIQVMPEFETTDLASQLLGATEAYLKEHKVARLIGGAYPPYNPFYHGLCRFSELPGVLVGDSFLHTIYREAGYEVADEFALMDCQLGPLRPVVDRHQRQLARAFLVRPTMDHTFDNWWDTCAFGPIQRSQFEIIAKSDKQPCGSMLWWDLEATREGFGPGVALSRVEIVDDRRRTGLATFLVMSALKQLKSSGASRAQVQVPISNQAGLDFFRKLGFAEVGRGTTYGKVV